MAENVRSVAIGEMIVSDNPQDVLVAFGLGSCAAVWLYDPAKHLGGMVHGLLPVAPADGAGESLATPAKYVSRGVPMLINALAQRGAVRSRLVAGLCGGARMITAPGFNDIMNIGERNVQAAEEALKAAGIPLAARATGGAVGRTLKVRIETGRATVRSAGGGEQAL